jgi:hypothetical protein
MEDTLGHIDQENVMIPLNDDWLSWPPESLDSFFNEVTTKASAVSIQPDTKIPESQSLQEHRHETR